jgi:hypothetical protein
MVAPAYSELLARIAKQRADDSSNQPHSRKREDAQNVLDVRDDGRLLDPLRVVITAPSPPASEAAPSIGGIGLAGNFGQDFLPMTKGSDLPSRAVRARATESRGLKHGPVHSMLVRNPRQESKKCQPSEPE